VSPDVILAEQDWTHRQRLHRDRVRPWVEPRQHRRTVGVKHPTDDFLFEYYPYSVSKLLSWHPGHGVVLAGDAAAFLTHPAYVRTPQGVTTTASWLGPKRGRLDLAISILAGAQGREPMTGCFALHEWAMVYGLHQDEVRHHDYPLRVSPDVVRHTVDAVGLRCTHIDAFRFFTAEAAPLNSITPTRATQSAMDQPGCLHANMDLYKYAMWFSPLVGSDLIADCFELAREARTLDMRASPYDVAVFGTEPIRVETPEGRREYVTHQRRVVDRAGDLRARLLAGLSALSEHGE
jgi:hypothetical protein